MALARPIAKVFLNIPYDGGFEDLYLAYLVGLTLLGLDVHATLAVPDDGRLNRIIKLIEQADVSIHDLSRIETSRGIPRFNMPLELGLALYRSAAAKRAHRVFVFEKKAYRAQRSTSDINGLDPQIHRGNPKGVMVCLRNILRGSGDTITVPQMLACYRTVKKLVPEIKRNSGSKSLFSASAFTDLKLAALLESERRRAEK